MNSDNPSDKQSRILLALAIVMAGGAVAAFTPWPLPVRSMILCAVPLTLWLLELTPLHVPTIVLLACAPLALATPDASLGALLQAAADPVLVLFLSGFCLAQAIRKQGLDRRLAAIAVTWSGGSYPRLQFAYMAAAAILSMWMSNVAAASLLFATLGSALGAEERGHRARLLVGIAMGANIGGMITPMGSGPNGIALAEAAPFMRISFVHWASFSLPLAALLLGLAFLLLRGRDKSSDIFTTKIDSDVSPSTAFLIIGALTVAAWLAEPLHGVPAPVIGAACCAALFLVRVLDEQDLRNIDWGTLFLVAGGLMVGSLLESSGAIHQLIAIAQLEQLPGWAADLMLVFASALLSALMSNTATAIILIPIGLSIEPSAATAVLIAVATSLGMPFAISTPPNAMALGYGATAKGLLGVGLPIMLFGVLLVGLTGRMVLRHLGVP